MGSISPLSFLSSTLNVSASTNNPSYYSLLPPSASSSSSRKPKRLHHHHHRVPNRVSCNANSDGDQPLQGNRRDVLIGLGGLASAASFTYNPFAATANPVSPDLSTCGLPTLPAGAKPTKCCPPSSTKIIDFEFPTNPTIRVRQPAHRLSAENVEKYKKALKLMRALPADDPRSFTQQANIHCAYCHNSYHQVGYPDLDLQVHFSWIFLPFHRWYIYFYERILGSLINDPTFALPFWNWDHPDGMEMPSIFTEDPRSSLYDALRNPNHQPPILIDLNWNKKAVDAGGDPEANLKLVHTRVYEAKRAICFYGNAFRAGDTPYTTKSSSSGTLELLHNTAHVWTGDPTQPNGEDMGSLYSAGRDPIFYCHHSNVDRLWSVWKSFGRKDIDDTDFLDSSFLFYDENKNLVRVKTRDCLDTRKMGYDFEKVDLPWVDTKPQPRRTKAQRKQKAAATTKTVDLPLTLKSIVSTVVKRPQTSRTKAEKEAKEESLVFELEFDRRTGLKFDVLINEEEDESLATPLNREFAGSFVNIPHTQTSSDMTTSVKFVLGITDILDDLDADDEETIVVTLVPQYGSGLKINSISIDYEACS